MSNEATNVALLKEAYRQWHETRGGSVDHWIGIFAENISFGSSPRSGVPLTFAKQYDNREDLRGYFAGLLASWTMVHHTVDNFFAKDDVVIVRGSAAWINKKTGKTVETPNVDFWRFRDGKAIEFYGYFDAARVAAAIK